MLRVPRCARRPDTRLEMLVERAERIARLTLQHVARERLGRLRPVVERRQPKRGRAAHRLGAVAQATIFMDRLVVAQARNDFTDAVEIVPPLLAEQPDPALEQPVQQSAVPLRVRDPRRPQRLADILQAFPREVERKQLYMRSLGTAGAEVVHPRPQVILMGFHVADKNPVAHGAPTVTGWNGTGDLTLPTSPGAHRDSFVHGESRRPRACPGSRAESGNVNPRGSR